MKSALVTGHWGSCGGLKSRGNIQTKNDASVCENAVKGIPGGCTLVVIVCVWNYKTKANVNSYRTTLRSGPHLPENETVSRKHFLNRRLRF